MSSFPLSLLNSCTVAEVPAGGKSTHLSALSQSEASSWGVGGTKEKERENHRAEIKSKEKRAETRLRGEEREQQLVSREGGEREGEKGGGAPSTLKRLFLCQTSWKWSCAQRSADRLPRAERVKRRKEASLE